MIVCLLTQNSYIFVFKKQLMNTFYTFLIFVAIKEEKGNQIVSLSLEKLNILKK